MAWVLIDLCKLYEKAKNYERAQRAYNELVKLETEDDLISEQSEFLRKIVEPSYDQVKRLSQLSKDGQCDAAINGFKALHSAGQLSAVHHEDYGWAIYRLLKANADSYTSVQVRRWLKRYLDLENDRPSMVHSQILNWTMKYAETDSALRTMDFLKLWDAKNLSYDDLRDGELNGDKIPSLFSRLCRRLINDGRGVDVQYLITNVEPPYGGPAEPREVFVLDTLREQYFWQLWRLNKENQTSELWRRYENYTYQLGGYPASRWHSEVLQLAERCMNESNEHRFLSFFRRWNPDRLRNEDWKETNRGEATYSPLGQKALKKACAVAMKKPAQPQSLNWLIAVCREGVSKLPEDEYLPRNLAQLLKHNGQLDAAVKAYRKLTLTLGDKYYVWKEFAELINDDNLQVKTGMLAKALAVERNEDFVGEVRLLLANCLLKQKRPAEASLELDAYQRHRVKQGWRLDERFDQLQRELNTVDFAPVSSLNYNALIEAADEYAYNDIPWTKMTLVDKYTNDKGKPKVKLYADKQTVLALPKNRFRALHNAELGTIVEAKLSERPSQDSTRRVYSPLIVRTSSDNHWSALPLVVGVVDFVNKNNGGFGVVTHCGKFVYIPTGHLPPNTTKGEFVIGRLMEEIQVKEERVVERISMLKPKIARSEDALSAFPEYTILVDDVNVKKQLFHFISHDDKDGIVLFKNSSIRPQPGDHFKAKCYIKKNKKSRKNRLGIINLEPTEEILSKKVKRLEGIVDVIHKTNKTFGFIKDIYVPGHLLAEVGILTTTYVAATAVLTGSKWRVIRIKDLRNEY